MDTNIDLHRFDDQIKELERLLLESPPEPDGILFYGSSTMANWRGEGMCREHMTPLPVTNMGFGGGTVEEMLYYYPALVKPTQPAIMACYFGANDLANNYTPEDVIETTHRLFEWARTDFPGIKFVIIPIKLCPALEHIEKESKFCNDLFADYAARHDDVEILDVSPLLYDDQGDYRTDVYLDDMLHHNRKGYEELAALLKPTLERLYGVA